MRNIVQWRSVQALARITSGALLLAFALMLATSGVQANDNPKPPDYSGTQEEWEELDIGAQKFWHDINVATWDLNLAAAVAAKTEAQMTHLIFIVEECGGIEPPTVSDFVAAHGGPVEPSREQFENELDYLAAWLDWWDDVLELIAGLGPELQAQWELVLRNVELLNAIKEAWELIHWAEAGLDAAKQARESHCTTHPLE